MPTRFRFRWIPFIAALAAATLGILLGNWQTRRAHEKEAIELRQEQREKAPVLVLGTAALSVDEAEFRHVSAVGEFIPAWTIYLDNRPYQGNAGFYVLTPFRISGSGRYVLVARGWVARNAVDRTRLPSVAPPGGVSGIDGIARRSVGHVLQLGEAEPLHSGAIVQNVDVDALSRASGLALEPYIVEQTGTMQDGLVRDWPRPSLGVEKHRGYAFQWYALAAMSLAFFFVTGFRRGTN